jgi:hypothetical protein
MALIQGALTHGHTRAVGNLGLVPCWRKRKERDEAAEGRKHKE